MFCSKCGKQIKDGMKFCPFCGAQIAVVHQTGSENANMRHSASNASQTSNNSAHVADNKKAQQPINDKNSTTKKNRQKKKIIQ